MAQKYRCPSRLCEREDAGIQITEEISPNYAIIWLNSEFCNLFKE